jgi:hypothetical protein
MFHGFGKFKHVKLQPSISYTLKLHRKVSIYTADIFINSKIQKVIVLVTLVDENDEYKTCSVKLFFRHYFSYRQWPTYGAVRESKKQTNSNGLSIQLWTGPPRTVRSCAVVQPVTSPIWAPF